MSAALSRPFPRAAIAYGLYGLVYLFGAWLQLTPDRRHDFHGVPWWAFFVAGSALILIVPTLIWREHRRFTAVMSIFPAIKAMTILLKQGKALGTGEPTNTYNWFFVVVALIASTLMFRAGLSRPSVSEE